MYQFVCCPSQERRGDGVSSAQHEEDQTNVSRTQIKLQANHVVHQL